MGWSRVCTDMTRCPNSQRLSAHTASYRKPISGCTEKSAGPEVTCEWKGINMQQERFPDFLWKTVKTMAVIHSDNCINTVVIIKPKTHGEPGVRNGGCSSRLFNSVKKNPWQLERRLDHLTQVTVLLWEIRGILPQALSVSAWRRDAGTEWSQKNTEWGDRRGNDKRPRHKLEVHLVKQSAGMLWMFYALHRLIINTRQPELTIVRMENLRSPSKTLATYKSLITFCLQNLFSVMIWRNIKCISNEVWWDKMLMTNRG